MHTSVTKTVYDALRFGNLALAVDDKFLGNLRTDNLRQVLVADDGTQIAVLTTDSAERVSDKRHLGELKVPRGWQAITVLDKRPGCELLIGTEAVDRNPGIASVLAGIKTLLEREGKASYIGCAIADQRCYMRKTGVPFFTDVTAAIDAAEIAYVPGAKVYLARRHAQSSQVGFLSALDAGEGSFQAAWRFMEVKGLRCVSGIQPRITRASAVMIHGVSTSGQTVTLAVNLEEIATGRIRIDADVPTAVGLRFDGLVGEEIAQVQTDRPASGLQPGVSLVHVTELAHLFGPAAQQFQPQA